MQTDLLVMFGDTTLTPLAVLASQRCPDHACDTEVGLVKFPHSEQLLDNGLLLGNAVEFGDKSWIEDHGRGIKVRRNSIQYHEEQVEEPMAASKGTYYHQSAHSVP